MDWTEAIERHRLPLLRIVATLFAMIGLSEGGTVERLSWPLYRAVLRVLRPAEAAVRRLIIVAARDMVVTPSPTRPASAGRKRSGTRKGQGRKRRTLFQLFDPRERVMPARQKKKQAVVRAEPRIRVLDCDPLVPWFARPGTIVPAPAPKRVREDTANAASLCRRLAALKAALEDVVSQAKRYARWRAKPLEERRPKRASALRPGTPPGFRKKPTHEVDQILNDCDWLALSLPQPDTS